MKTINQKFNLDYDSFFSCTEITKLNKTTLTKSISDKQTRLVSTLKDKHLDEILTLVRNSRVFSKKEKEKFFK